MNFFTKLFGVSNVEKNKGQHTVFGSTAKKVEFISLNIAYIALAVTLTIQLIPNSIIQILGQVQSFIAVYLAFRFRYPGLVLAVIYNSMETSFLIPRYILDPSLTVAAGLTSKVLTILTSVIVSVLANRQEMQKQMLHIQKVKLEELSVTDDLTSIYNQRFFNSVLDNEMEKANLYQGCIGLILIDIDNFKMHNDIYGHDSGDIILKETAFILKTILAKDGILCRYGGDEFAVILPDMDFQSTKQTAFQIHEQFEKLKSNSLRENMLRKVTLSMGLSEYPNVAKSKDELISQADMALYHSKNRGKNNIHFYQDVIKQLRKNISSDNQQLIGAFRTLLSTISAKDKYTLGHSERVSNYAMLIGNAMNLSLHDISTLQYAGLLHDIGKIEIPKSLLNKVETLSSEEYSILKKHPEYSSNILEPLEGMDQLLDFVIHHHERYDGKGYPHSLSGEEISLGARILCVADCFDAMLSERPYSKGKSMEEAFHELQRCAGTQFDPDVVKVFISAMKESNEYKAAI